MGAGTARPKYVVSLVIRADSTAYPDQDPNAILMGNRQDASSGRRGRVIHLDYPSPPTTEFDSDFAASIAKLVPGERVVFRGERFAGDLTSKASIPGTLAALALPKVLPDSTFRSGLVAGRARLSYAARELVEDPSRISRTGEFIAGTPAREHVFFNVEVSVTKGLELFGDTPSLTGVRLWTLDEIDERAASTASHVASGGNTTQALTHDFVGGLCVESILEMTGRRSPGGPVRFATAPNIARLTGAPTLATRNPTYSFERLQTAMHGLREQNAWLELKRDLLAGGLVDLYTAALRDRKALEWVRDAGAYIQANGARKLPVPYGDVTLPTNGRQLRIRLRTNWWLPDGLDLGAPVSQDASLITAENVHDHAFAAEGHHLSGAYWKFEFAKLAFCLDHDLDEEEFASFVEHHFRSTKQTSLGDLELMTADPGVAQLFKVVAGQPSFRSSDDARSVVETYARIGHVALEFYGWNFLNAGNWGRRTTGVHQVSPALRTVTTGSFFPHIGMTEDGAIIMPAHDSHMPERIPPFDINKVAAHIEHAIDKTMNPDTVTQGQAMTALLELLERGGYPQIVKTAILAPAEGTMLSSVTPPERPRIIVSSSRDTFETRAMRFTIALLVRDGLFRQAANTKELLNQRMREVQLRPQSGEEFVTLLVECLEDLYEKRSSQIRAYIDNEAIYNTSAAIVRECAMQGLLTSQQTLESTCARFRGLVDPAVWLYGMDDIRAIRPRVYEAVEAGLAFERQQNDSAIKRIASAHTRTAFSADPQIAIQNLAMSGIDLLWNNSTDTDGARTARRMSLDKWFLLAGMAKPENTLGSVLDEAFTRLHVTLQEIASGINTEDVADLAPH